MQPVSYFLKSSEIIQSFNKIFADNALDIIIKRIFTEGQSYPVLLLESEDKIVSNSVEARPVVTSNMTFKLFDNSRNYVEIEDMMEKLFSLLNTQNDALIEDLPDDSQIHYIGIESIKTEYAVDTKDSMIEIEFTLVMTYEKLEA